jgi:hypothetical protein
MRWQQRDSRRRDRYPGIMVTDTAEFRNPAYHCRNGTMDIAADLDLDFMTRTTQATVGATIAALDP